MTENNDRKDWPGEAGDPGLLMKEITPPDGLEDRTAAELLQRGLISTRPRSASRPGWWMMRGAVAAAACVALLAVGFAMGRAASPGSDKALLTDNATDLYAVLLYETSGYDKPLGAEALTRYREYSQWVATARQRGQFVAGEDLETERGWLLAPGGGQPALAATLPESAALSGMFLIRAGSPPQALSLAKELPHLRHGGMVLVQKTIPTDQPPET